MSDRQSVPLVPARSQRPVDQDRARFGAIALDPASPTSHSQRARLLAEGKYYDRAVVAADKAVRPAPDDPMVLADRARILTARGDGARALADYDRAVASGKSDAGAFDARAGVRASAGAAAGAKADREAAARLRSGSTPAGL